MPNPLYLSLKRQIQYAGLLGSLRKTVESQQQTHYYFDLHQQPALFVQSLATDPVQLHDLTHFMTQVFRNDVILDAACLDFGTLLDTCQKAAFKCQLAENEISLLLTIEVQSLCMFHYSSSYLL